MLHACHTQQVRQCTGTTRLCCSNVLQAWLDNLTPDTKVQSTMAMQEAGYVPYPLLWLRYSTFVVLYPLGVASEMTMVYLAMPSIRKERPLSFSMPNRINFAFDYYVFCWLAIACYVPGLPELYFHMLRQRKKILGQPSQKAKKVA